VPYTVLADSAAGWLMARGDVDAVLVGADRIAANGDTANKIGTYPLAVLAARHGVPFYVCAPLSSVDLATPDGSAIQIEQRAGEEVTALRGIPIAPAGSRALNPSFDATPAELITAIVTEEGALRSFLEQDRLFAAYPICDLEDREWNRTRWGAAYADRDLVAVVLEYGGSSPQPIFVMGRTDGIVAILRDVIRPRAAYAAALPE